MRQTLVITIVSFLIFSSCKKDKGISAFRGLYIEAGPIAGQSQLNFINNKILIKTETGSSYKDIFYYSFTADTTKIILTPVRTNDYSAHPIDFEKIDENSFKIATFIRVFPNHPEAI